MAKGQKLKLMFNLRNDTPGAHRYQQVDEQGNELNNKNGGLIGTLYLRKSELPEGAPKRLVMETELIY